jgi:hypothetical protein
MLGGWASRGASNSSGSIGSLKSPGKFKINTRDGAESIAVVKMRKNASWVVNVEDLLNIIHARPPDPQEAVVQACLLTASEGRALLPD